MNIRISILTFIDVLAISYMFSIGCLNANKTPAGFYYKDVRIIASCSYTLYLCTQTCTTTVYHHLFSCQNLILLFGAMAH